MAEALLRLYVQYQDLIKWIHKEYPRFWQELDDVDRAMRYDYIMHETAIGNWFTLRNAATQTTWLPKYQQRDTWTQTEDWQKKFNRTGIKMIRGRGHGRANSPPQCSQEWNWACSPNSYQAQSSTYKQTVTSGSGRSTPNLTISRQAIRNNQSAAHPTDPLHQPLDLVFQADHPRYNRTSEAAASDHQWTDAATAATAASIVTQRELNPEGWNLF